MNWRIVLIIIVILEGIYYLINRFLFNRTFKRNKLLGMDNYNYDSSFNIRLYLF